MPPGRIVGRDANVSRNAGSVAGGSMSQSEQRRISQAVTTTVDVTRRMGRSQMKGRRSMSRRRADDTVAKKTGGSDAVQPARRRFTDTQVSRLREDSMDQRLRGQQSEASQ